MLPLAAPASAIGTGPSAVSRDGGYAAVAAASSWSLASWLGALLTTMWGQEKGYIDPVSGASTVSGRALLDSSPLL